MSILYTASSKFLFNLTFIIYTFINIYKPKKICSALLICRMDVSLLSETSLTSDTYCMIYIHTHIQIFNIMEIISHVYFRLLKDVTLFIVKV